MMRIATTEKGASSAKPRAAVKVRSAAFEDYDAIHAVEKRNGLVTRTREDWTALWAENPAYKRLRGQWSIAWVMETPSSEIVGTFSSVPLAYRFGGRDLTAAIGVGWAVDAPYRAYSIWLIHNFLRQSGVDLFLSTTTSPEAEPVLRFLKWSPAPAGEWQKSSFWVTGHRGFLNAALQKKKIRLPGAISAPVAALWSCLDGVGRLRIRHARKSSSLAVELASSFDERFEQLWQEMESRNRNLLLAVRSQDTLAWHFRTALAEKGLWILTASRDGRLMGYAIFDKEEKSHSGLRRVRLIDFIALDNEEEVLRSLLCWMLERCRRDGIHVIEVFGCWLDRPELARVRFPYRRALPSCLFYYYTSDHTLREALSDPSVWRPSSFDGDASLGTWGMPANRTESV